MNYRLTACMFFLFGYVASVASHPPRDVEVYSFELEFSDAFASGPNTLRIPFQLVGRLIGLQARVDTVQGTFFLDTGAERLLLNKSYFRGDYKLNSRSAYGSTGIIGGVWVKKVDTLFWDNLRIFNTMANVLDLSHIEQKRNTKVVGIIGYEVFKDFEVFLDYPNKMIILSKLGENGERLEPEAFGEMPFDSVSFELSKHAIILEAKVNAIPLSFNLDTGAELNLIDRRVNKKVLENFKILKRVNLKGAGKQSIETLAGLLFNLQCGVQPNYGMRTLITNLDNLRSIYGVDIQGVLGFEFLRPKRTVINYKKKKLFFYSLARP